MDLDDPTWTGLRGGYGLPYDARAALRALERTDSDGEGPIWTELWDGLHHQGDVGEAAYFVVPHLVRIARSKPLLTPDTFTFIAVVELGRSRPNNGPLPAAAEAEYLGALRSLPGLVAAHAHEHWDAELTRAICAALAAMRGHGELALALLELDPHTTRAFLKEQIGYEPPSES